MKFLYVGVHGLAYQLTLTPTVAVFDDKHME